MDGRNFKAIIVPITQSQGRRERINFSLKILYKNAKNVIIINDPIVARQYLQNWLSREHVNNNLTKKN